MAARRRWVPIVFGVAVLLVFIGIGVFIAVTAWFQQNMQVKDSTDREAQAEFEGIRHKFGARAPLLELRDGAPRYASGHAPDSSAERVRIETLNLLVWDPDDERLARFSLPFWLLRMKPGPIRFGTYASGLDEDGVDLKPEDIEKYGAGVILDTTTPSGERVLVWAQ